MCLSLASAVSEAAWSAVIRVLLHWSSMVEAGVGGGGRGYGFASCCGAGVGDAGGREIGLWSALCAGGGGFVVCAGGGGFEEWAGGGGLVVMPLAPVGSAGMGWVGFG